MGLDSDDQPYPPPSSSDLEPGSPSTHFTTSPSRARPARRKSPTFPPYSKTIYRLQRLYARSSSRLSFATTGSSENPINSRHPDASSHLETPWWEPESSKSSTSPQLERSVFIYHTQKALDVARAAEHTLKAAEHHLECLVTEEELTIEVLRDEIQDVRTKSQAARHQVASLRAKLQSEGVTPKAPLKLRPLYSPSYANYFDPGFEEGRHIYVGGGV